MKAEISVKNGLMTIPGDIDISELKHQISSGLEGYKKTVKCIIANHDYIEKHYDDMSGICNDMMIAIHPVIDVTKFGIPFNLERKLKMEVKAIEKLQRDKQMKQMVIKAVDIQSGKVKLAKEEIKKLAGVEGDEREVRRYLKDPEKYTEDKMGISGILSGEIGNNGSGLIPMIENGHIHRIGETESKEVILTSKTGVILSSEEGYSLGSVPVVNSLVTNSDKIVKVLDSDDPDDGGLTWVGDKDENKL